MGFIASSDISIEEERGSLISAGILLKEIGILSNLYCKRQLKRCFCTESSMSWPALCGRITSLVAATDELYKPLCQLLCIRREAPTDIVVVLVFDDKSVARVSAFSLFSNRKLEILWSLGVLTAQD
jgi:hypothetical protein